MRSANRRLCWLLCTALACVTARAADAPEIGVVSRAVPEQVDWLVRIPVSEKAVFRGLDGAGASNGPNIGMMYPGPLPVFLAGILIHGLVSSSAQNSRAAAQQAEADKVLLPYQATLDLIGQRQVMEEGMTQSLRGGLRQLTSSPEPAAGSWVIETAPVFSLTQDERALVMDSVVAVFAPDAPTDPIYKTIVRVVSQARPESAVPQERVTSWTSTEGRLLRQVGARLVAESLDMVMAELARGPEAPAAAEYKTVRYPLGGRELMERATVVAERCDRLVLKTLRGGLLSVPRQVEGGDAACGKATAPVAQASARNP